LETFCLIGISLAFVFKKEPGIEALRPKGRVLPCGSASRWEASGQIGIGILARQAIGG